jgi:hypothetical protein
VTTGSAGTTGIPCAMVLTAASCSPWSADWSAGLDSLYRLQVRHLQAWSQRRGIKDHTTWPSADAPLAMELSETVSDLQGELGTRNSEKADVRRRYEEVERTIRRSVSPDVEGAYTRFVELIEERSALQNATGLYDRLERLRERRAELVGKEESSATAKVSVGIPDSIAHQFSMKVEHILRAWNFPGECRVHFDRETSDFVIDGKPRGSRGKGLRAITHAAISIALLEFCRERTLPHPGFVVMDSPLLAYFEPEGEDDAQLQGSYLKERFYSYLKTHHGRDSQIVIIENQHPPPSVLNGLAVTVFTRNPGDGRFGLLQ